VIIVIDVMKVTLIQHTVIALLIIVIVMVVILMVVHEMRMPAEVIPPTPEHTPERLVDQEQEHTGSLRG